MKQIGLHLRYLTSWADLAKHAFELKIPHFQCFLTAQDEDSIVSDADVREFRSYSQYFRALYAHGSYSINYASKNHIHYLLKQELDMIARLGFTHYVIHPGAFEQGATLDEGIDHVARVLNSVIKKYPEVTVLIENTAYDGRTIGYDIDHLKKIFQKIDKPDHAGICIDTAHAYVAGYDIAQDQAHFMNQLRTALPSETIKLLHVSDTTNECGSFKDLHCMIGQGLLGETALRDFASNDYFAHANVIIELPHATEQEEKDALVLVRSWFSVARMP